MHEWINDWGNELTLSRKCNISSWEVKGKEETLRTCMYQKGFCQNKRTLDIGCGKGDLTQAIRTQGGDQESDAIWWIRATSPTENNSQAFMAVCDSAGKGQKETLASQCSKFSPQKSTGLGSGGCRADGWDHTTMRRTSLWIHELVGGTWGWASSEKVKVKVEKVP